jgi:hypothetical protein
MVTIGRLDRPGRIAALCALAAAALVLAPSSVTADDPEPAAQRVELPEIGLAASFPAEWRVRTPMSPRESWFDVSTEDETPIFAWTGIFATAGDGRWCGIDRFEDFPWTFDEHAAFLESWHVSASLYGRAGGYERVELPAGSAWRIEVHDEIKQRSSTIYLLQQADDHVLLTCADHLGSEEDWLEIAASIELGPRTARAPDVIAAALDAAHAD